MMLRGYPLDFVDTNLGASAVVNTAGAILNERWDDRLQPVENLQRRAGVEIIALVTSIVSVLIAAGSLVYARRSVAAADRSADASEASADAARKSAWLQSEDDWRARTPSFEIEWDDVIGKQGNAKTYGATLRSYGPEPYESVFIRLLHPPAGEPNALQGLIDL